MNGSVYVEKQENGQMFLTFEVKQREDVNELTLNLIDSGFDVLYEPGNRTKGYESCIICGEKMYFRIVTNEKKQPVSCA